MSATSKILSTGIALPAFSKTTPEITPYVRQWLKGEDKRLIEKAVRIYEMAQVGRRYSIMPAEEVFAASSFEEKNNTYIREMKGLCEQALATALDRGGIRGEELDAIITVSCTGFMIPSMDAYLINKMQLPRHIVRLPVTEMGCAAGTSAMIYAHHFLQAHPGKKVAIVAFESPTATLQHHDTSMTNIVSSAIFGDGVAAVIMGSGEGNLPTVEATEMFHFYDEEDMMGFDLTNRGLKMVLDVAVPEKIGEQFENILMPFLEKNKVGLNDINHLLFHPGGKKIIKLVEEKFNALGKNLDVTKSVLHDYGNMSSATVLYVLDRFMGQHIAPGQRGLMLSFGPGFSAQMVLLKWE